MSGQAHSWLSSVKYVIVFPVFLNSHYTDSHS